MTNEEPEPVAGDEQREPQGMPTQYGVTSAQYRASQASHQPISPAPGGLPALGGAAGAQGVPPVPPAFGAVPPGIGETPAPYAYVGTERPTAPARFGKVGCWILIGGFALRIGVTLLEGGLGYAGLGYSGWVMPFRFLLGGVYWVSLIVATVFGLIGLSRRERPLAWPLTATLSLIVSLVLNAAVIAPLSLLL